MAWRTRPAYCKPPCEPEAGPSPANAPAGYSVMLGTLAQDQPYFGIDTPPGLPWPPQTLGQFVLGATPLSVSRNPQVGAFLRDPLLVPGTFGRQTGYVPAWTGDRIARDFRISYGAIGHRRPTHGTITLSSTPGGGETETPG